MDINDTKRAGLDLGALIQAADADDAIIGAHTQALASAGLELLRELLAKLQTGDSDIARRAISEAATDERWLITVGSASLHRATDFGGLVVQLKSTTPRSASAVLADLLRLVKAQHQAAKEKQLGLAKKYQGLRLDNLLRPLGVQGLRMPDGWLLEGGKLCFEDTEVAEYPICIIRRLESVGTGEQWLELAWRQECDWVVKRVRRKDAMRMNSALELAGYGAPINSTNALQVIKFLAAFESANIDSLEKGTLAEHMGWVGETFLVGNKSMGGELAVAGNAADMAVASAYHQKGTWVQWCNWVRKLVLPRPLILLGIYASAATPLLRPLARDGFVFEWSGDSSKGKTTALLAAASVWGSPDTMGSWSAAGVTSPLHKAWFIQSMPLLMDETKHAAPEFMRQMLYQVPQGRDKERGERDGSSRESKTWRLILMSTGESLITSKTRDGGAQARAICLDGEPCGPESQENAEASLAIKAAAALDYGHLGPRMVAWIQAQDVTSLRQRYSEILRGYQSQLEDAIMKRLAECVSVIHLSAEICHQQLNLPGKPDEALQILASQLNLASERTDMVRDALEAVYRWATANRKKFWDQNAKDQVEPSGGWLGRWDSDYGVGFNRPEYIGFAIEPLRKRLAEWGYDPDGTISNWRRRGMLKLDGRGKNPQLGPGRSRVIAVLHSYMDPP